MTTELELLRDTARRIFSAHASTYAHRPGVATAQEDAELWRRLRDTGFARLSIAEDHGGSGGGVPDLLAVVSEAARACVSVPLVESTLLAGWLLAQSAEHDRIPDGPATFADGRGLGVAAVGSGFRLTGRLSRVPWARSAEGVAVTFVADGAELVAMLEPPEYTISEGTNMAREARDDVSVEALVPPERAIGLPAGTIQQCIRRHAIGVTTMLAATAQRVQETTVGYARRREQFGRAIGSFQAVQHLVAELAGHVALMSSAADAVADLDIASAGAALAVAAAKAQASRSAGVVAAIAHQVHGAFGITEEGQLWRATMRLWSWRDEAGDETYWSALLGEAALAPEAPPAWHLLTADQLN